MNIHDAKVAVMRDLGMEKVSYRDGEPWPSDDELENPDLSKGEIDKLRNEYSAACDVVSDIRSKLYPHDHTMGVYLNYIKFKHRMHKVLKSKSGGTTL